MTTVLTRAEDLASAEGIVVLGNFDGVHLGHRYLIEQAGLARPGSGPTRELRHVRADNRLKANASGSTSYCPGSLALDSLSSCLAAVLNQRRTTGKITMFFLVREATASWVTIGTEASFIGSGFKSDESGFCKKRSGVFRVYAR